VVPSPADGRRRRGRIGGLGELAATVAVAIGLALVIEAVLVKPYKISSGSMEATLAIGQRVLVDRLDTSPAIGDIVVFHPPAGADPVTPVCGQPGEGVSVAGVPLARPCDRFTPRESTRVFIKRLVGLPGDVLRIVDGHVIRNGRRERDPYIRSCGPTAPCTFAGSITVPRGAYYMMGDNRGLSDDSRFWGPVPRRWIIGVAIVSYWPPDRIGTL
jgi:signal peptidase I